MASKCGYRFAPQFLLQGHSLPVPSPPNPFCSYGSCSSEGLAFYCRDTAGQERYQTITKQYYRRAQGIFLVYDISSERSYQHIMKWVSDVDEYAPEGVQKILIGNKADEEQKRQVGREQGQQLAKEYGMDFYETSACTNLNIKESFTRLTELVLQAHRKELDGLQTHASNELALAELEEEDGKAEGPANSSKTCWC
ncbi:ras-related protein Rab-15 isoform X4 [Heterocephalus glaber]|uniref:small monomeric GTPase n=1 Tax=Heterocephalus glaber TaxID=10181 RepID=A0AAX6NUZ2_HETGA|nr:ras-related protein Rab-15 isoform X4 [Heterocephalus glaber]XP_004837455.1 ras-related protein Rab-15 isoform X4 [Heterocephalus glaber]XP_004837456.1 ras-related protein Rab-15 isoform X4 [Heterocephalus glaber]XP_021103310.1 ras-related protein Rab-15 isoform X4 [Heterocephalus glaber]